LSSTVSTFKLGYIVVTIKFIKITMVYNLAENKVFCLNKLNKIKMDKKNILVFFLVIASLFLVAGISAATTELATIDSVKVNGVYEYGLEDISVVAGETVSIEVFFTALENASDVRLKAELEGSKVDVDARTSSFDVESGKRYRKTLTLKVPYELKDEVSDNLALNIQVWNGEFKTENSEITLRVQRPTYNADIMSISTAQTVEAGETISVDIVLKNTGYNYLDDLYVTARIPALGLERTSYFGDLVAFECNDDDEACDEDDEDVTRGRFYFQIPYDAKSGIYTIEVEAENSDLTMSEVKQIVVNNDLSHIAMRSGDNLLIVNPTTNLKVYKIVSDSQDSLVVIPAGSSREVPINIEADSDGKYNFDVNVLAGDRVVDTVSFTGSAEGISLTSPIAVLTIILAIIFIVLLVVLVVLLGKKPETQEEFGESYY